MNLNRILGCVLLLISITSIFPAEPIIVDDNFKSLVIGKYLEYYEDKEGKLTIEDVSNPGFQSNFIESRADKLNFGYTTSSYWVKFRIQSKDSEQQELLLEYFYPLIHNIQFYTYKNHKWELKQAGDTFSFKQRDVKNRNIIFKVPLGSGEEINYYIRLQNKSAMLITFQLYTKDVFIESLNDERFVLGIYYGLILVMILYNILLYLSLRDILYIYYVLYLTSFLFYQMGLNGISFEYIWNETPYLNSSILFWVFCIFFFGTLFSQRFLNTKLNAPGLNHFFNFSLFVFPLIGVLSLNRDYQYFLSQLSAVVGLTIMPIWLINSFIIYLKGYKPARFYILAFTTIILGAILLTIRDSGYMPSNFFTEYTIQIGSALESILLSFAVADRILFMRKEQEETKNLLIQSQQESIDSQKKLIQSYARFVPEELLEFLGKDIITKVNLGDAVEKDMTVLFSDIRSFTALSESMTPTESFEFINSYLKMIAPCIRKYNGYIDKYIGDGIMALFPENPGDAIQASIEMLEELNKLNLKRIEKGRARISVGIGIHTGKQMVGIIGEEERLEGTVISDIVNTSSRLEGLTKAYACSLIVSEDVLNHCKDMEDLKFRFLDTVKVKGKNKSIRIYEILNGNSDRIIQLKLTNKSLFENAIHHYLEKDFEKALSIFQEILEKDSKDKASELYITRCNFYLKNGVSPDWDGIEKLDFK